MSLSVVDGLPESKARPDLVVVGSGGGPRHGLLRLPPGPQCADPRAHAAPTSLTYRRSGEGVRAPWGLPQNIAIARESIDFDAGFADLVGGDEGAG